MTRPKFLTRTIRLVGQKQIEVAKAAVEHAPVDPQSPLEVVIREERKTRSPSHNDAMWAGPLRDISEQAWVNGRRYTDKVWHHFFKIKFLPETNDPDLAELVKDPETYEKWAETPDGERILVGSTTQLTPRGFSLHLMQVEAYGAELGVQFSMAPRMAAA